MMAAVFMCLMPPSLHCQRGVKTRVGESKSWVKDVPRWLAWRPGDTHRSGATLKSCWHMVYMYLKNPGFAHPFEIMLLSRMKGLICKKTAPATHQKP
jgi:hypothetical protein